jgi:hypothetical protein
VIGLLATGQRRLASKQARRELHSMPARHRERLEEINPYAPPQHDSAAQWPLLPVEEWPKLQFQAVGVSGSGLLRTVRIAGTIEAQIDYDGWTPPSETVRVNGVVRGRGNPWDFSLISPTIEFTIDGDGYRLPARIDVRAGLSPWTLFRLSKFRLTIAGKVVHEE